MAYTCGDKCPKNCCKRTILVQLIVENVITCFLEHSVGTIDLQTYRVAQNEIYLIAHVLEAQLICMILH